MHPSTCSPNRSFVGVPPMASWIGDVCVLGCVAWSCPARKSGVVRSVAVENGSFAGQPHLQRRHAPGHHRFDVRCQLQSHPVRQIKDDSDREQRSVVIGGGSIMGPRARRGGRDLCVLYRVRGCGYIEPDEATTGARADVAVPAPGQQLDTVVVSMCRRA